LEEVRCSQCGKLLFRKGKRLINITGISQDIREQLTEQSTQTEIEILCRNKTDKGFCKTMNRIKI
jgi:hypothetical protein